MNLLCLIFLFLFFACLGDILTGLLRSREKDPLVQIGLGLIAASYLAFLAASQGWLDRNLILILMSAVIFIRITRLLKLIRLIGPGSINFVRNLSRYEKVLLIILILQILINFFLTLTPPTAWDSLAYHLGIPKMIVREGRMINYADYGGTGYPLLIEMIFTLGLLFQGALLSKLICWSLSVLTVIAIYNLAARIELRPVALMAGLIFYTTQVVSMWVGTCYIDIAFAFFVTIAVILLINFGQGQERSLISVWVFVSILPGIKYSGFIFSFIMGAYLISRILMQKKNIKSILKPIMLGGLIILAVNSPWYLVTREEPLSGEKVFLYNHVLAKPTVIRETFNTVLAKSSLLRNYLRRWLFTLGQLSLTYDRDGRIGPLFLSFLPLLFLIRPLKKEIRILLMISLAYMAIFLFFGYVVPRYLVPLMPILGILVAYVFMKVEERDKVLSYFLGGCLVFTFIFNLGLTLYNHRLELSYLAGKISKDDFLNTRVRSLPAINYINENIHRGAVLLIGETRTYYLERPFFIGLGLMGRSTREVEEILKEKNITHVLVNERVTYRTRKDPDMQEVLKYLDKLMEMIYQQGDFKVYKLKI